VNPKWDWVILSAFTCVFASSGTWGSLWLWISCFSWWLLPPRCLGEAEELWQEFVIVLGHLPTIVRGSCPFPDREPKATLVDCACHWATLLAGRFLRCPSVWTRFVQHLLAAEPATKCWSTQRELACQQAREPREKNRVSPLWLIIWIYHCDWSSSYCDWFIPRCGGIKITFLLFTFPQTCCNKLFSIISFESLSYLC
jgi:hypothetical protein